MFGKLGELASVMKNMGQIQAKIKEFQSTVGTLMYDADSGAGAVTVTVNGKMELVKIRIRPDTVNPSDVEMLEDLIQSAVAAAQRKAADGIKDEMRRMSAGLGLPPGVENMLGGA